MVSPPLPLPLSQGVLLSRLQPGVDLPHLHPSHRLWQLQVSVAAGQPA